MIQWLCVWKQIKEERYCTFMRKPSQVLCSKQNSCLNQLLLCVPWRHRGRAEVWLHSFLTWVLEPVWTFWRKEKSLSHAGNWTPDCQGYSLGLNKMGYVWNRVVQYLWCMGCMVTNLKLWVTHTSFILDGKIRLHEGVLVQMLLQREAQELWHYKPNLLGL